MIKVPGVMHVRVVTGRHGEFRVGRLVTDLGEFAVKDAELDQYEEGRYEGEFGISQISPSYYSAAGRLIVEVRARLSMIALVSEEEPDSSLENSVDLDPIVEVERSKLTAPKETAADNDDGISADAKTAVSTDDQALFGLLWPLGEIVKLDPTAERTLIRQQRDRLKKLGYRFRAIDQHWTLS